MTAKGNSLRNRQIASLKKILNLNQPIEQKEDDEPNGALAHTAPVLASSDGELWKILVFDDLGRDVISSVLRVSDLRSLGVTMHL